MARRIFSRALFSGRVAKASLGAMGVVSATLMSPLNLFEERGDHFVEAPQVVDTSTAPAPSKQQVDVIMSPGDKEGLNTAVYKICLTGGPCGGKSTALSLLTRRLQSLGFQIFVVPEAATLLFNGGFSYDGSTIHSELSFEANKIKTQMALEDAFMSLARTSKKPTVIICDRGTMDSRAYVGVEKWHILLQEQNWTVQQLRDMRYDAVFHLVTTAIGAETFYSNANNATRLEDAKTARELDTKILGAWVGHPKVFIIDNSTDFDGKMNRVVTSICRLLGVPRPKQIDRKFLVNNVHIPQDIHSAKHFTETLYLKQDPEEKRDGFLFLRSRGDQPNSPQTYFYSAKHVFPGGESAVMERQITGLEFSMLQQSIDPSRRAVRKKVKVFQHDLHYYELEQWLSPHNGLLLLKTSVDTSDEKVSLPPFVSVIREVTDDPRFSTHELASVEAEDLVFIRKRD